MRHTDVTYEHTHEKEVSFTQNEYIRRFYTTKQLIIQQHTHYEIAVTNHTHIFVSYNKLIFLNYHGKLNVVS